MVPFVVQESKMNEKLDQFVDVITESPDEILINIASKLGDNFFSFMSASKRISSIMPTEFKQTCALIKKYFPQDYSWFYQFLTQLNPPKRSQFSLEHNPEVHYQILSTMIRNRLTRDIGPMIKHQLKKAKLASQDLFIQELEEDLLCLVEQVTTTITWEQILYLEQLNQMASTAERLREHDVLFYDGIYLSSWIKKNVPETLHQKADDIVRKLNIFIKDQRERLPFDEIKGKIEKIFEKYSVSFHKYSSEGDIHFLLNFPAHKAYIEAQLNEQNSPFDAQIFTRFETEFKNQYCPRENNQYLLNARRDIKEDLIKLFEKHQISVPYYFKMNDEYYVHYDHHIRFIDNLKIDKDTKKEILKKIEGLKKETDQSPLNIRNSLKNIFDVHKIEYGEYFITANEDRFLDWSAHVRFVEHLDLKDKEKKSLLEDLQNLNLLSKLTLPTVSEKSYDDDFSLFVDGYKKLLSNVLRRYQVNLALPQDSTVLLDFKSFERHLEDHLAADQFAKIHLECQLIHDMTLQAFIYKRLFNQLIALSKYKLLNITEFYYHLLNTMVLTQPIIQNIRRGIKLELPLEAYFSSFRNFLGQSIDIPLKDAEFLWFTADNYGFNGFRMAKMFNNQELLNIFWSKHGNIDTDELIVSRFWDFDKIIDHSRKINLLQWQVATNQPAESFQFYPEDIDSLELKDALGNTLLHYAAFNNDLGWLKKFIDTIKIKNNFDLNYKNKAGQSPLLIALKEGNYSAVDLLLQSGASFKLCSAALDMIPQLPPSMDASLQRITPLHVLVRHLSVDELEMLAPKWLAEINVPNEFGQTPLHVALVRADKEIIQWLLTHGANVTIKDQFGLSVVDYVSLGIIKDKSLLEKVDKHYFSSSNIDMDYSLSQAIRLKNKLLSNFFLTVRSSINIKEYLEISGPALIQRRINQALINGFKKHLNPESKSSLHTQEFFKQIILATNDVQIKAVIKEQKPEFLINLLALAKIYQKFSKSEKSHYIKKLEEIDAIVQGIILGTPVSLENLKNDKNLHKIATSLINALTNSSNNNLETSQTFTL